MATPTGSNDYTDGRPKWDWSSKYPPEARKSINAEAGILTVLLVALCLLAGLALCMSGSASGISTSVMGLPLNVDARIAAIFLCGNVGGTTFSIKWLIHSVAHGNWHLDRRYWRLFVPLIGGVYACVVLTLFNSGFIGGRAETQTGIASSAALAFLVGYFSDGVSGTLSNIANAVFGTLREK